MMIDLNELQIFVHVSQARSFTLAAKHLGVPKSSVSRAISRLERRLGTRLVERTTRRVDLTEAGALYLDRCQRVLEEAEQADVLISALQATPRGRLRVGASLPFARWMLAPILGNFLDRYPDLQLQLHLQGVEDSAGDQDLDVVIRPGPVEDSRLPQKPLLRIRLAAYASPAYLKGRTIPDSPADLRQHRCIAGGRGMLGGPADSTVWRLYRGSDQQEVQVESRVSVSDPMISYQLALTGVGVALLNQITARADVDQGRLVRLLPDWEPEPKDLHAVYPSRLASSPKVRVFVAFLREHFGGED